APTGRRLAGRLLGVGGRAVARPNRRSGRTVTSRTPRSPTPRGRAVVRWVPHRFRWPTHRSGWPWRGAVGEGGTPAEGEAPYVGAFARCGDDRLSPWRPPRLFAAGPPPSLHVLGF